MTKPTLSQKRDLITLADLSKEEFEFLLGIAGRLKADLQAGRAHPWLPGTTLAMIFEKPSLRTRVTFEAGMNHLGGVAIYLAPGDIQLGSRESVPDIATNLSCWVDAIMARTFSHSTVVELGEHASVPVINGLSDLNHPCQVLADCFTLAETPRDLSSLSVTFVGDGNNVVHSWLLAAATMAYSWRTLFAFGSWTAVLWVLALIGVGLFGLEVPELSIKVADALVDYERMLQFLDPNELRIEERVQEIMIFLIVASILALNGKRTNSLLVRQAEVARERANLARHFPPITVDQMAGRDQPLRAVRSQQVAVMFVYIVGFTSLAERKSAKDIVVLLREFHRRMEAAVFDHGGTLDKFLGDGLMATFGNPDPGLWDAANALACGRAMLADMDAWNDERTAAGEETITVSGQSPVVDIQQAERVEVLTAETLDAIPTGGSLYSFGTLVPGIRTRLPDIGGARAMEQVLL